MNTLFSEKAPLAERMRPQRLDDLIGQEHLVGPDGVLGKAIRAGNVPSMILWGPPRVGKTTIADRIAHERKKRYYTLSAVSSGLKEVRDVSEKARRPSRAILLTDEIHRYNEPQQDALLGAVQKGTITLIGATTENPSFEVNSALLSRCQVYTLNPLSEENLLDLVQAALTRDEVLSKRDITLRE